MKVSLELQGDDSDIAELVSMAVAGGLLIRYEVDKDDSSLPEFKRKPRKEQPTFAVGARVRVRRYESRHLVPANTYGQVLQVIMDGPVKKAYLVRWEDGKETRIGGSALEVAT